MVVRKKLTSTVVYTFAKKYPRMTPPKFVRAKCASPVEQRPCTNDAIGWVYQPEGKRVPGSFYCAYHAKRIVDQFHQHERSFFHFVLCPGFTLADVTGCKPPLPGPRKRIPGTKQRTRGRTGRW